MKWILRRVGGAKADAAAGQDKHDNILKIRSKKLDSRPLDFAQGRLFAGMIMDVKSVVWKLVEDCRVAARLAMTFSVSPVTSAANPSSQECCAATRNLWKSAFICGSIIICG